MACFHDGDQSYTGPAGEDSEVIAPHGSKPGEAEPELPGPGRVPGVGHAPAPPAVAATSAAA